MDIHPVKNPTPCDSVRFCRNRLATDRKTRAVKKIGTALLLALALLSLTRGAFGAGEAEVVPDDEETVSEGDKPDNPNRRRVQKDLNAIEVERHRLLAQSGSSLTPIWLNPSQQEQLLALWQIHKAAKAKGAVIVMAPPGAAYPGNPVIQSLAENLLEHGWSLLTLIMPEFLGPAPPARPAIATTAAPVAERPDQAASTTEDETQVVYDDQAPAVSSAQVESTPETSTATNWQHYRAYSQQAIEAAMAFLNAEGQYNLALIGIGRGAELALYFTHQAKSTDAPKPTSIRKENQTAVVEEGISALILVEIAPEASDAAGMLTAPGLATLDLFPKDRPLALRQAHSRGVAARRQTYETYIQKGLPAAMYAGNNNKVGRLIRGFLDRHVAGVEM